MLGEKEPQPVLALIFCILADGVLLEGVLLNNN